MSSNTPTQASRKESAPASFLGTSGTRSNGDFDPYRSWLKVTEPHRPLSPYDLLGLETCESDPNRIAGAAKKTRALLDNARDDADPERWSDVNEELQRAIDSVSSPEKKTLLDASIRRNNAAAEFRKSLSHRELPTVNGALNCASCDQENSAQRLFCASCGSVLWKDCISCKSLCATSESFCGACGTNLAEAEAAATGKMQTVLEQAEQAYDQHAYEEATRTARQLARLEDPRFHKLADAGLQLLQRISVEEARWRAKADEVLEQAQALTQKKAFGRVREVIEQLPETYRNDEVRQLHRNADFQERDRSQLMQSIKSAVKKKDFHALSTHLVRLLKIEPEHEQGRQLARQLATKLCQKAKAEIVEHEFAKALETLQGIPDSVTDGTSQNLVEVAKELHCLRSHLQTAPYADPVLPKLAERLCKIIPGSKSEIEKLTAQIRQRVTTPCTNHAPFPVWVKPPAKLHGPLPFEWMGTFEKSLVNDSAREVLENHPGEFFAAAGLALQGVQPVFIPADLLKPLRKNRFAAFTKWMSPKARKEAEVTGWGIDVGHHALKAIQFVSRSGDGEPTLEIQKAIHIPLPDAGQSPERRHAARTRSDGDETPNAPLSTAFQQLREAAEFGKNETAMLSVSAQSVLGRWVNLPPIKGKARGETIQKEVEHQMPYRLDELAWDYHDLGSSEPDKSKIGSTMLLAAKRSIVEQTWKQAEKDLGVPVSAIQPDVIALLNWVARDYPSVTSADDEQDPLMVLDVGATTSNVAVVAPKTVWFRSAGFGGDRLSQAIAKSHQLTFGQAEALKHTPHRAHPVHALFEACEPEFEALTDELSRSLQAVFKQFGTAPKKLIVCGGGVRCHGLLRYLMHGPQFGQ